MTTRNLAAFGPILAASSRKAVNTPDIFGVTPLMASVTTAHVLIPLGKILVRHGNHRNTATGSCVLDSIARLGLPINAAELTQAANGSSYDPERLLASVLEWQQAFPRELLAAGADPAARDINGNTVAHYAAYSGNLPALRMLPAALLHEPNARGITPRRFAEMGGFASAVAMLGDEQEREPVDAPPAPVLEAVDDCDIDVVQTDKITLEQFRHHYWDRQRPVLFRNSIDSSWLEQFSFQSLETRFGHEVCVRDEGERRMWKRYEGQVMKRGKD